MFKFKFPYKVNVLASLIIGFLAAAAAAAAGRGECAGAARLEVDSTFRGFAGSDSRFALELEAPGIVTLELAAAGLAEVDARIGLLDSRCSGFHPARIGRDFVLIEEAATRLVFAALRPGTYFVGLSSDPRRALGEIRLNTRFAERELHPRTLEIGWRSSVAILTFPSGAGGLKDEDHEVDPDPFAKDEDHEVDPDPFAKRAPREWIALLLSHPVRLTKDEDHEVDPDPFAKESEFGSRDRLIRFAAPGDVTEPEAAARLAAWIGGGPADGGFRVLADDPFGEAPILYRHAGCRAAELDDHGDTFACASSLSPGARISAELANGWGDDEDVYRFRLERLRTVTVEAVGGSAPRIALYDRFGQRLETAGFSDGPALVLRTLSAGDYFVRVWGEGPGSYELSIE